MKRIIKLSLDWIIRKFKVRSYSFVAVPTKQYYKHGKYVNDLKLEPEFRLQFNRSLRPWGSLYKWKRDKSGLVENQIKMYKITHADDIAQFDDARRGVVARSRKDIRAENRKLLREQIVSAVKEAKENNDGKVQQIR
jgi:hypothetical protein